MTGDDDFHIRRPGKGGVSLSFGIQDATNDNLDRIERNEALQLLADRGIGGAELAGKMRRLYERAGSPEGEGTEGLVRWLEKL